MVGLDDVAADRQAQAGAPQARGVGAGLGGEERLEDPPQVRRRDPDAVVGDAQLGQPAGGVGGQPERGPTPPSGIAWRALMRRLSRTCWIWRG